MKTFFESIEPRDPNPYKSTCPICDKPAVTSCRCLLGDKWCENKHQWHECPKHKVKVIGSGHDTLKERNGGRFSCTCSADNLIEMALMKADDVINTQPGIIAKLRKFQTFYPNLKFKHFWKQFGNNDPEDFRMAKSEYFGMKNKRDGRHLSADELSS